MKERRKHRLFVEQNHAADEVALGQTASRRKFDGGAVGIIQDLHVQEHLDEGHRRTTPAEIAERCMDRPTMSGIVERLKERACYSQRQIHMIADRSAFL